jgi:GntR family transcriptional repressor for pyruvate dehydrogenase complex
MKSPTPKSAKARSGQSEVEKADGSEGRLYQELAGKLFAQLASGVYAIGDRIPPERELALEFQVSRPTVREAIIALEVQGFLEVKVGSGAYVRRLPGAEDRPGFNVTAFELTEARILIEGESAALASTNVTDADIAHLKELVRQIADENLKADGAEHADREFHLAIARITRNNAMVNVIEELWRMRATSPDSALLHAKARLANVRPVVDEHAAIVEALASRDPAKARAAMRAHLGAVLDHLLFATEEQAIEEAKRAAASTRARFTRATAV